ncbi:Inosine/uridine-preferring nucleoside hydrolase [Saccharata proteae CBS 121410]|uniref:Inosine/uridine-preferring nucleoside hydrolase n=1 Tax=Saccharata proteae CBS 121410 TaxID=1314787 RepID=A0A9P4I1X2_9PEZI|nr:Inosine/uridine-preferring nucleoside hydrolase [Saccharata proteae CBS 121410]
MSTPVWLDVDPGHDDAFAILLAAYNPKVSLLGISTVHGNASLYHTTQNSLRIAEALGLPHVPIYAGSSKPLQRDAVHAATIHGESGLDGTTLLPKATRSAMEDADFVEAIYSSLIKTPPKTAWLVATGTLTNAAKVIQAHPDLADHLAGFSLMGGAVGGGFTDAPLGTVKGEGERFGNWTPFAEFNIYCDPEAAHFLLSHPVLAPKTVIMPLDLTHQVLGTVEVQSKLLGVDVPMKHGNVPTGLPTPIRALYYEIMTFFAKTYADEFALVDGPPLHDPLAVAAAFEPNLFVDHGERFTVEVVTQGVHKVNMLHGSEMEGVGQLGRTIVKKTENGAPGVRIPRTLDVPRFWDMIDAALTNAEKTSPLAALGPEWWDTRF